MKTDTIIRTLVLVLALVNQVLAVFGMSPLPIEEAELEALLSSLFTVGASVWAWWKNNSFTKNAIEADNYLATLKKEV
jgi:SPP1 family holin